MHHLVHHHDPAGQATLTGTGGGPATGRPAGRQRTLAFAVLLLCCFAVVVDLTVTNLALPTIATDFKVGTGALQWVVDAYNLALAGLLLLGGGLADRFGRKRIFLSGFALFGVGCLAAALAPSIGALVGARVLMGVGAAFVLTPSMAIIAELFAPEERPRAIAVWAVVGGLGIAVGPVVGGLLLNSFSWGSVFLINVPLVVVAVAIGVVALPESRRPGDVRLDPVAATASVVGLATLMFGIIEGPSRGWGSPPIVGSLVAGVAVCTGFVLWELRQRQPMFDPRILRRPPIAVGAMVLFIGYGSMMAMLFLVPTFLQSVRDFTVVATGLMLLGFAGSFAVVSNIVPALVRRHRVNRLMALGLGLQVVAAAAFAVAPTRGGSVLVVAGLCVAGVSIALVVTPSTTLVINGLPDERAGEGSSLSMLSRFVGATFGVAVVGSVFAMRFTAQVSDAAAQAGLTFTRDMTSSFHNAVAEAERVGGPVGQQVAATARQAFDHGFAWAFTVVAVGCLAGLVALVAADRRAG